MRFRGYKYGSYGLKLWELRGVNHKVMPDYKTMASPDNTTTSQHDN